MSTFDDDQRSPSVQSRTTAVDCQDAQSKLTSGRSLFRLGGLVAVAAGLLASSSAPALSLVVAVSVLVAGIVLLTSEHVSSV